MLCKYCTQQVPFSKFFSAFLIWNYGTDFCFSKKERRGVHNIICGQIYTNNFINLHYKSILETDSVLTEMH